MSAELLWDITQKCGRQSARKCFVDAKAGEAKHIGYIIGGEWFRLYEVHDRPGGPRRDLTGALSPRGEDHGSDVARGHRAEQVS